MAFRNFLSSRLLVNDFSKFIFTRYNHLQVSKPAPNFCGTAVVGNKFKEIQLNDYKGKYLYLFFYPLDFTFVCPTEIIAFNDRANEFKKINTEIVACSIDSHFSHLAWSNIPRKEGGLGNLNIPLLSDITKKISSDYNVLIEGGFSLRGSFLIDTQGILKHVTINDLSVGRSVDEALRIIEAFQFVEKHGEVCPVNWKPNTPTINPANAKEYFSKVN